MLPRYRRVVERLAQTGVIKVISGTDTLGVEAYYSDCAITEFQWDFGDGQTETSALYMTEHTYTEVGTYTVTLTVTDSELLSDPTPAAGGGHRHLARPGARGRPRRG